MTLYHLLSKSDADAAAHSLAYEHFISLRHRKLHPVVSFLKNMNSNSAGTRKAAGWPIRSETLGGGSRCSQPLSPAGQGAPAFPVGPRQRPRAKDTPRSSPRCLFRGLAAGGGCSLSGRHPLYWGKYGCVHGSGSEF